MKQYQITINLSVDDDEQASLDQKIRENVVAGFIHHTFSDVGKDDGIVIRNVEVKETV
jgi:hypothetical protein